MSALKRIRDFKAPKDDASAEELRRQLVQFEQNVSDMGDAQAKSAMPRLVRTSPKIIHDDSCVMAPGQFQLFDTSVTNVSTTFATPQPGDAGKFSFVINLPGSTSNLYLRAPAGRTIDGADHATIVTAGNALIFCDGVNYWTVP
ncbi:MAG TPA: hypothetical protein VI653_13130 [Steroidobacteraceae bacterium]